MSHTMEKSQDLKVKVIQIVTLEVVVVQIQIANPTVNQKVVYQQENLKKKKKRKLWWLQIKVYFIIKLPNKFLHSRKKLIQVFGKVALQLNKQKIAHQVNSQRRFWLPKVLLL